MRQGSMMYYQPGILIMVTTTNHVNQLELDNQLLRDRNVIQLWLGTYLQLILYMGTKYQLVDYFHF